MSIRTALALLVMSAALSAQNIPIPAITSATTNTAATQVTLEGVGFGSATPIVKLVATPLTVVSHTSTTVVAQLPTDVLPGSYVLTVTNEDTHFSGIFVAAIESAAPPAGPTGPTGPTGPQGLTGPQGPAGSAGAPGTAGAPGATGARGATGPIGATGATGPQGPMGNTGATGATGPIGPIGATGTTGPIGPIGASGTNGLNGAPGVAGPTGPTGATGAPGLPGSNNAAVFLSNSPQPGGGTYYQLIGSNASTNLGEVQAPMPSACTVDSLIYQVTGYPPPKIIPISGVPPVYEIVNPGAATVLKNGVATSVSCAPSAYSITSAPCSDTSHTATFNAGDQIAVQITGSSNNATRTITSIHCR